MAMAISSSIENHMFAHLVISFPYCSLCISHSFLLAHDHKRMYYFIDLRFTKTLKGFSIAIAQQHQQARNLSYLGLSTLDFIPTIELYVKLHHY